MAYGQINYPQIQGINGKYTIHDIGCFITGFANLLTYRFNHNVDPLSINNYLREHNLFIDIDDGVRDDVGWNFVSYIDAGVIVTRTGAGWPSHNRAIVKFVYQSKSRPFLPNGKPNMVTHFCLVEDPAAKTIVDSWDGMVKKSPYGEPVAFAEYAGPAVSQQAVTPPQQVNFSGKQIFLPARAGTWRVYNEKGPYYVGKEIGKLWPGNPEWAPGLAYDILGNPQRYVYIIQTEKFDRVAIYGGPDTIAEFRDKPAPAPAPTPAPSPAPAAQPPAPAKQANIVYSKLAAPLDLVVNKQPTNKWKLDFKDDVHVTSAEQLPQGTAFRAFGKAQRTDGDKPCYYMTEEDFGKADESGTPANNIGVNTVDLSPPAPKPTLVINDNSGAPEPNNVAVTTPAPTGDNHVPVNVAPNNPEAWKTSFKTNLAGEYIANASVVVHDLEGKEGDHQLVKGKSYHIAGTFIGPDKIEYYRTKTSADNNAWIGIPTIALQESQLDTDGDIWDTELAEAAKYEIQSAKGKIPLKTKAIKALAEAEAKKLHLPHFGKKKK